jgi:hypothetical protein
VQGRLASGRDQVRAGIVAAAGLTGDDAALVCADLAVAAGPLARHADGETLAEVVTAAHRLAAGSPALDVPVRHIELIHATITDPRPELVPQYADLFERARAEDNHYTAWNTAANAARLLLDDRRAAEAVTWARAALRESIEAGLRDNGYVLEVYGAALGLAGDDATGLRVFGAVEAQHGKAGVPWPRDERVAALVRAMRVRLGEAAADRARAEGARAKLAEFADA